MFNIARFWIGNLLIAWALSHYLGQHLHYPADLPIRFHPQLPALTLGAAFSLATMLSSRLLPTQRWLRQLTVLALILSSVALAGALCAALVPGLEWTAGAQIGLLVAYHSPLVSLPAGLWALLWTNLSFPLPRPAPASQPKAVAPDWQALAEPAGEWIGSSR